MTRICTVSSRAYRPPDKSAYLKKYFLYFWSKTCCGYPKEPSRWDGSFEHPKHMLKLMNKEIFTLVCCFFCLSGHMSLVLSRLLGPSQEKSCFFFFYGIFLFFFFWKKENNQAVLLNIFCSPMTRVWILSMLYGPRHEKTCLWRFANNKGQTSLRIHAVWSAPLLFGFLEVSHLNLQQAKFPFSS